MTADTMKLAADDVQSVIIPGSGHYCLEEAPDEVLKALTAFLAPPGKHLNKRCRRRSPA